MNIMKTLSNLARRIPILGALGMCSASNHREACQELFISFLISMSPVYIGAFVLYIVQHEGTSLSYLNFVKTIVHNGELFIYASTVLAPVVYIVSRDRYNVRSFPSKFTFIGAVILVSILSTCIFTIQRIKSQILPQNILVMSFLVFLVAVAVFYFALVYNNWLLPDPANLMRSNERDFAKRLLEHRQKV